MARDPYLVLGVSRRATEAEIKKAFRQAAKESHPDRNQGDAKAAARFVEINNAYDILGDDKRRGQFDRGEINAAGQPASRARARPRHSPAEAADLARRAREARARQAKRDAAFREAAMRKNQQSTGKTANDKTNANPGEGSAAEKASRFFKDVFGQEKPRDFGGGPFSRRGTRGPDHRMTIRVSFDDACKGCKRDVTLRNSKSLKVSIPAGVSTGQVVRLKGQGGSGGKGRESGDLLMRVMVENHILFERDGDHLKLSVPVGVREAKTGGKIAIPTLSGIARVSVPKDSVPGTVLRLKGKGIKGTSGKYGDLLVTLRILPTGRAELEKKEFRRKWQGLDGLAGKLGDEGLSA